MNNDETKQQLLKHLNPNHFELIIFPTEQCNFRCTYCYEDFEIGKMGGEIVAGVKNLIRLNAERIRNLHLSWFGGEPLLAMNIIDDISKHALRLASEKHFTLTGSMTTNGYLLTTKVAKQLVGLGVTNFQISLDGASEGHNATRRLANGAGSFDVIWKNLNDLRHSDLDLKIMLRLHLTRNNIHSIYELSEKLRNDFLSDERFSVYLKCIEDLGGPNAGSIDSLDRKDRDSLKHALHETLGLNSNGLSAIKVCYAAKPNSYVIRADGRIQKCTVALDSDHNTLGKLRHDGTFSLDQDRLKQWMRGFEYGDTSELQCPASNHPAFQKKDDVQVLEIIG